MRDEATVSSMLCPVCKTGLALSDRQGVEIDYCPQCRGVWLDRGELDKIIERAGPPASEPAQEYRQDTRGTDSHGGRPYKKKRESFLGDLFDF